MIDVSDMCVSVVGTGSVGRRHARNLLTLGISKVVLCSEFQGGGKYLEELNKLTIVKNYNELLKLKLDAIVIANASNLHIQYAEKALKNDIPIYLEKPAGVNADEIANLLRTNKIFQQTIAVGYQHRFNPLLSKVRKFYINKSFGQIVNINCTMGEYLPNYHPEEDYRVGYAAKESMGGGVLRTQIHDINYLHWIFGELDVLAVHGGQVSKLEIDVEDSVTALLKTKNNEPVTLHMDYLQKKPYRILEIQGIEGRLRWNYYANSLMIWSSDGTIEKFNEEPLARNQLFLDCMKNFLISIKSKSQPISTLKDGYVDMKLVDILRNHFI